MTNPTSNSTLDGIRMRSPSHAGGTTKPHAGIMLLNPDRSAYAGLLGESARRIHGALDVYVSLTQPFRISIEEGPWEHAELAVVPPFVPHVIASAERVIGLVQCECETIDPEGLPPFLRARGALEQPAFRDRMRTAFARLRLGPPELDPRTVEIDSLFFGERIGRRRLDPRVARVAERIRQRPCATLDGGSCADLAGLSSSRFLHLFKAEVGTTFRRFRAWKRARSMLLHVSRQPNLADFALELGYPDATHFSHSIRNFLGLTPKDIFSGSRRLAVVLQSGACPSPQQAA